MCLVSPAQLWDGGGVVCVILKDECLILAPGMFWSCLAAVSVPSPLLVGSQQPHCLVGLCLVATIGNGWVAWAAWMEGLELDSVYLGDGLEKKQGLGFEPETSKVCVVADSCQSGLAVLLLSWTPGVLSAVTVDQELGWQTAR
jgi:hypothetical protein